jgi:hypothetical protein
VVAEVVRKGVEMTEPGYARKANVVKTCWTKISPKYDRSPETEAVIKALDEVHKTDGTAKPDGYHVDETYFSFLYSTRSITDQEKNDIDALFNLAKRELNSWS